MKLQSFVWMPLLAAVLFVGLLGCSPSAEKQIPGTWQGVNGIAATLVFGPGGDFTMKLPAIPSVPFTMENSGSYSITASGAVQILEGGENYVGELRGGELVMVRPWGGGVSTRFQKVR
jgi:hypothetical protein